MQCPAGRHSNVTGLQYEEQCDLCPIGHFCSSGATAPTVCPAGRFGDDESLTDAFCSGPCARGHYCEAGSTNATAASCGAGTFNPSEGMGTSSACIVAPLGHYSLRADIEKRPCPAGRYGATERMLDANCSGACSPGHYCVAGSTSSAAAACAAGTYRTQPGAGSQLDCTVCEAGHECPIGATQQSLCAPGTHAVVAGAPRCTLCPVGRYNPSR